MADEADVASEIADHWVSMRVGGLLQSVNTVSDNTHCEDCGDEIPAARRKAAPWATLCLTCQETQEKASMQYRR
ncbi:TraR/DksA C4-type zinc finger protein [Halomonas huangheensis]|uniref:TraR/DksA C4-type zinc finger protein n=2 Tax=Halomonas huangheensis TaxID=1178482 RepID=UPI0004CE6609